MKRLFQWLLISPFLILISCGGSENYNVGVFNNTNHEPVNIQIQYPSSGEMKRIRFSTINIGEFKSNQLNTNMHPVPNELKIVWMSSEGEQRNAVLGLDFVPDNPGEGAIIINIDEVDASVRYFNKDEFAGEWEERLARKGHK
jgi:hypothetical protein